jgi:hypothetical protein
MYAFVKMAATAVKISPEVGEFAFHPSHADSYNDASTREIIQGGNLLCSQNRLALW